MKIESVGIGPVSIGSADKFTLVIVDDNLANWLMINNCFVSRPPNQHLPQDDYWNGVVIYLNDTFSTYRKWGRRIGVNGVALYSGATLVTTITREQFHEGAWLYVVLGNEQGLNPPMKPEDAAALFNGTLHRHAQPFVCGIVLWQDRNHPLTLESRDRGPLAGFRNQYTFESTKGSKGFEIKVFGRQPNAEDFTKDNITKVEVMGVGGGGPKDPTNPPQYP
jgi:hypothetical protein